MKCPICHYSKSKVLDSRKEQRRRRCFNCGTKFFTVETVLHKKHACSIVRGLPDGEFKIY